MITESTLFTLARSFPNVTEEPHFDKTSFRIKKKIFATYDAKANTACVKLNAIDQDAFMSTNRSSIYPSTGKWGEQGWTMIELKTVHNDVLTDALTTAYHTVAHPSNP